MFILVLTYKIFAYLLRMVLGFNGSYLMLDACLLTKCASPQLISEGLQGILIDAHF